MSVLNNILERQREHEKWHEVKEIMATHMYGSPPKTILKKRRPLESQNDYALDYRLENFQPFTKEPFNLALSEIVESADQLSYEVINIDTTTEDYVKNATIRVSCKDFNLKDYSVKYLGEKAEADPNGIAVTLPIHPTQKLIPDYREELPNFNLKEVKAQSVILEYKYVPSDLIYGINEEEVLFYAGEWIYDIDKNNKELHKPYFWLIDKHLISLVTPKKVGKDIIYVVVPYYGLSEFNESGQVTKEYFKHAPFHVLGHNLVLVDDLAYYESNFAGAVPYFNKAIGIESDLDVSTTKFTYPREFSFYDICNAGCSYDPDFGYHGFISEDGDSCTKCAKCNGTGLMKPHTSPLGTTLLPREDAFDSNGEFKDPYLFRQPPIDGVKYMDEATFKWLEMGYNALYITRQNMTNQSGESKSYDYRQKISNRTKGVKNIFRLLQCLLNDTQAYLRGEQNIIIELPSDFQVKTAEDITSELVESEETPTTYKSRITSELFLKRFGNNAVNRRIIKFLSKYDVFYGYTNQDIINARGLNGNAYTFRDTVVHDKGFDILLEIAEDKSIINMKDEQLKPLFDNEINLLVGDREISTQTLI